MVQHRSRGGNAVRAFPADRFRARSCRLSRRARQGHYADRELAYAYLKTNELDKALEHAKIEYARRPDNIDVNETMAWVLYKRGEFAEAQKYMTVARRTGSQNPVLLCRAGLILSKLGKKAEGQVLIEKSLKTAPYLNAEVEAEGKKLLAAR